MNDSKWPDTRELWLCLNCGSVEWHLRGEGKAILCECVAGVWTTMEQVWPAPWISVEEQRPRITNAHQTIRCIVWLVMDDGNAMWRDESWGSWRNSAGRAWIGWLAEPPDGQYTHWQPGPSAPE